MKQKVLFSRGKKTKKQESLGKQQKANTSNRKQTCLTVNSSTTKHKQAKKSNSEPINTAPMSHNNVVQLARQNQRQNNRRPILKPQETRNI